MKKIITLALRCLQSPQFLPRGSQSLSAYENIAVSFTSVWP